MSEVVDSSASRQPQFDSPPQDELNDLDDVKHTNECCDMETTASKKPAFAAPALRVEELKDELLGSADEMVSGSSACGTDDEFGVSPGDLSDQDTGGRHTVGDSESEFVCPDEELQARIVAQVEQYFADENILHDTFMLKHVRRNRLGYVSLKLVTSFRKVKPLTRDHRAVAYSLRNLSKKLEVNEDGSKVRRLDPLPNFDETAPSRSVIVVGLPVETSTMESVAKLFVTCGEISSIRMLHPGKPIPSDVKKLLVKMASDLSYSTCAIVEFEKHDSAVKACELISQGNNHEENQNVIVQLLNICKPDKPKKTEKGSSGRKGLDSEKRHDGSGQNAKGRYDGKTEFKHSSRVRELAQEGDMDSAGSESDASAENWRAAKRSSTGGINVRSSLSPQTDNSRLSPGQSPRSTPRSSPKSSPRTSPNSRRRTLGTSPLAANTDERRKSVGSSPSQSPWVQRRLKAQEASISPLAGNSPGASPRLSRKNGNEDGSTSSLAGRLYDSVGVIRQPKGPDGTKGFQARCKPGTNSSTEQPEKVESVGADV